MKGASLTKKENERESPKCHSLNTVLLPSGSICVLIYKLSREVTAVFFMNDANFDVFSFDILSPYSEFGNWKSIDIHLSNLLSHSFVTKSYLNACVQWVIWLNFSLFSIFYEKTANYPWFVLVNANRFYGPVNGIKSFFYNQF